MNERAAPSVLERLFSLRGKVILVTGAAGGIGRVLSVAMAEAGARLGLHDVAPEYLAKPCQAVREAGGEAFPLVADLSDVEACRQLIAKTHAALGRLDVLVNCAGVNRRKPIDAVTLDDYETITAINQRSLFFLSQAAHSIMRAQGGGKIINIGSLNSFMGLGTVSVYGMTKAAIAQVTKTMAIEWARDNIQVNCVAPGFMLTPLTQQSLWADDEKRRWLLGRIPMRRPGQPDELVGGYPSIGVGCVELCDRSDHRGRRWGLGRRLLGSCIAGRRSV